MNRSSWRGRRGRPRQNHNEVDLREKINRLRRDKIPAIQDSPLAEDDDDQISLSLSLSSSDSICKQPFSPRRDRSPVHHRSPSPIRHSTTNIPLSAPKIMSSTARDRSPTPVQHRSSSSREKSASQNRSPTPRKKSKKNKKPKKQKRKRKREKPDVDGLSSLSSAPSLLKNEDVKRKSSSPSRKHRRRSESPR